MSGTIRAPRRQRGNTIVTVLLGLIIAGLLGALIYLNLRVGFHPQIDEKVAHYSIVLANGQSFYAHIDQVSNESMNLSDIFYIQRTQHPETKEVQNALIRRGKLEWHSPKRMIVNTRSILLLEPVDPDSNVAKLIAEQKAKGG